MTILVEQLYLVHSRHPFRDFLSLPTETFLFLKGSSTLGLCLSSIIYSILMSWRSRDQSACPSSFMAERICSIRLRLSLTTLALAALGVSKLTLSLSLSLLYASKSSSSNNPGSGSLLGLCMATCLSNSLLSESSESSSKISD